MSFCFSIYLISIHFYSVGDAYNSCLKSLFKNVIKIHIYETGVLLYFESFSEFCFVLGPLFF